MKLSDFLKERNIKIMRRYSELKSRKMLSNDAKKIISREFGISHSTIDQVIYNKNYSNSPHK